MANNSSPSQRVVLYFRFGLPHASRRASLAHVPVVALTASVLSSERAEAMAAGFTALLAKPCFPEDVADAVTRILRERHDALTLRVDQQPFTSTPSLRFEIHPTR